MVIYVISDVGSVAGGWLSSSLIHRGHTVNAARKIAMLICAVGVIPVVFAYRVESTWSAVLLIGLAAACHQGFSANLFTLTSDMFPARAVAPWSESAAWLVPSVAFFIATLVGHVLQWTGSYMIPFVIASAAYLLALAIDSYSFSQAGTRWNHRRSGAVMNPELRWTIRATPAIARRKGSLR